MGKRFQKFCEWFNDCKYVPVGSRCGACGKKLNFFFTGFWSVNNQRYNRYLSDGVLCAKCKENAEHFIKSRKKWMSKELQAQDKWQKFDARNMDYYSVSDIKALMEQKELSDKENLSTYGSEACGLFEIKTSFGANTHPFQVGIVRARKLKNKMVVFGKAEEGIFRKNDKVKLEVDGNLIETTVLEAFVFDPEAFTDSNMDVNFNETIAANLRYTRKIKENKMGWLILDIDWKYKLDGGRVVKIG